MFFFIIWYKSRNINKLIEESNLEHTAILPPFCFHFSFIFEDCRLWKHMGWSSWLRHWDFILPRIYEQIISPLCLPSGTPLLFFFLFFCILSSPSLLHSSSFPSYSFCCYLYLPRDLIDASFHCLYLSSSQPTEPLSFTTPRLCLYSLAVLDIGCCFLLLCFSFHIPLPLSLHFSAPPPPPHSFGSLSSICHSSL